MDPDILVSDDSETEDIHELTVNEHYAKAFEYRKEREELQKRTCVLTRYLRLYLRFLSQGQVWVRHR